MLFTVVTIIQYVVMGLLLISLFVVINQKSSRFQVHAIILTVSTLILIIGYNFEMNAVDYETAYSGVFISYIGKPFVTLESFMLVCEFLGKKISKPVYAALGTICISMPAVVFTNNYHHLFYTLIGFDRAQTFSPLSVEHGPYYYVYLGSCFFFLASTIFVIVEDIIKGRKSKHSKRRKGIRICAFLMIIFNISGYAVYLFKPLLNISSNYDMAIVGMGLSVLTLYVMTLHFKAFDAVTIANDTAMDESSVGIIIYDESMLLSYKNKLADKIYQDPAVKNKIDNLTTVEEVVVDNKVYQLAPKEFYDKEVFVGKSIEINDITYSKNYQDTLKREVKERTERIENIQKCIVESFADVIESRSLETGDHIKRTSYYTKLIALELKKTGKYDDVLTDEFIELLTLAAPLHDVGKISISDTILLKPGKLTYDEFEEMKKHAAYGAIIIEKTLRNVESDKLIDMAKDVAEFHHEWWNGNGYPNGLKGDEIPLSARIVALADTYDALTSNRCYKKAYPVAVAVKIMEEESGTHFDPFIAKVFIDKIK